MSEPTFFKPHALAKAPVIRESRVITPLTTPRDYSKYEEPTYLRRAREKKEKAA